MSHDPPLRSATRPSGAVSRRWRVVAEHRTAQNGSRGRSINTYDAETGKWHLTWVSQFTIGHLRMAGGLESGEMVLHGVRNSVFGVPCFDDYTWTVLAPDTVRPPKTPPRGALRHPPGLRSRGVHLLGPRRGELVPNLHRQ